MLKIVLIGIFRFVKGEDISGTDKDENPFKRYLEESCAFELIIGLQENNDEDVSELAKEIIKLL